jgi:1-acyl-sn-glycerol-3-phosphate acyltransferase
MHQLKALWRICRVLLHVLAGAWRIRTGFPRLTQPERDAEVQAWALAMLGRLAIKLVVSGTPPASGPVLLAANHISWLDIVVIHAARHCRFISKADIQHWPLVGTLATGAGTLYIERESRRDAMRVVHHMAERLNAGDVLAVFPEGTTGDGTHVLPFHANLLQAAIAVNAPIQPVALQFADAQGQQSFAPCYVGDDTLLGSLWRTLCSDGIQAVVTFGAPQTADGRDRRTWSAAVREDIIALRQR